MRAKPPDRVTAPRPGEPCHVHELLRRPARGQESAVDEVDASARHGTRESTARGRGRDRDPVATGRLTDVRTRGRWPGSQGRSATAPTIDLSRCLPLRAWRLPGLALRRGLSSRASGSMAIGLRGTGRATFQALKAARERRGTRNQPEARPARSRDPGARLSLLPRCSGAYSPPVLAKVMAGLRWETSLGASRTAAGPRLRRGDGLLGSLQQPGRAVCRPLGDAGVPTVYRHACSAILVTIKAISSSKPGWAVMRSLPRR